MLQQVVNSNAVPAGSEMVPGFLVQAVLEAARAEGAEPSEVLREAAVAVKGEAGHFATPAADFIVLLKRLQSKLGPAVGLSLGRRIMEANLHVFGPVITASRSMREAYEHCDRLSQALNATEIGSLTTRGAEMHFNFRPMLLGPVWEDVMVSLCFHVTERFVAGMSGGTGHGMANITARFARPADASLPAYEACFGGRVVFGSRHNGVGFPRAHFDLPRPGTDTALATELCAVGLRRLGSSGVSATWSERVSAALRELGDLSQVDFDRVASRWGLNLRSLRRRLSAENTGPSELLDAVRFERARYYLEQTDVPVAEVGAMLGYAEATSFGRAFKRWSGMSPLHYRATHRLG